MTYYLAPVSISAENGIHPLHPDGEGTFLAGIVVPAYGPDDAAPTECLVCSSDDLGTVATWTLLTDRDAAVTEFERIVGRSPDPAAEVP